MKNAVKNTLINTVLFDIDGTLIDSNDSHAKAWVDVLGAHGVDVDFEDVRSLIGMGADQLLPRLIDISSDSDEIDSLSSEHTEHFRKEYLPLITPFRGTRELIARLKSEGFKIVIASSADPEVLNELLKVARVEDLIEIPSPKDAEKSKPAPDLITGALANAGAEPHQAIMIGDTRYDIEAAQRAFVSTIALLCGGNPIEDLKNAVEIYRDPADLLASLETSILGSKKRPKHSDIVFPLT